MQLPHWLAMPITAVLLAMAALAYWLKPCR